MTIHLEDAYMYIYYICIYIYIYYSKSRPSSYELIYILYNIYYIIVMSLLAHLPGGHVDVVVVEGGYHVGADAMVPELSRHGGREADGL